jgi:hypothetical protein
MGLRNKVLLAVVLFLFAAVASGYADDDQLTWQVFTGLGKEFKQRYSVLLGYRYLDVDYKNGGFLFDTHMSGLLAGFGIRFK